MTHPVIALLLGAFFAVSTLQADETVLPGASAAAPIQSQGLAARASSLGGAFVGVADDGSSLYWNPAGLVSAKQGEVSAHHNSYLLDGGQESLLLALPLSVGSTLGLGVDWVNYGAFTNRDAKGFATGQSMAYDLGLKVAMAWQLGWDIQIGAAASYLNQSLGEAAYSSFAADLGLLWVPTPRWRLGLSSLGLGLSSPVAERAVLWRAGASYQLPFEGALQTLAAVAASLEPGGIMGLQAGLEGRYRSILALRAGYQFKSNGLQVDGFSGLSLGLGLRYADLDLDYAYSPNGNLGTLQRVSVGKRFEAQGFKEVLGFSGPESELLTLHSCSYVGASVGGTLATSYQPSEHADQMRKAGYTTSVPPLVGLSGSFWAGYQFRTGIVLEAGIQINPVRSLNYKLENASIQFNYNAHYVDLVLYGLGGYRWVVGRNLLTLGTRFQDHWLLGNYDFKQTVSGIQVLGSGAIQSTVFGLGPAIRWERLMGGHASVGLELGYDAQLLTPTLAGTGSSSVNSSGQNPMDYSSIYARLTLTGWFDAPAIAPASPDPRPVVDTTHVNPDAVDSALQLKFGVPKDWYEAGRKFEETAQWREASEAYAQAVNVDPRDSRAWKALGGAYASLGRRDKAVESFRRYLELVPGDQETRQWLKDFEDAER